MVQLAHVADNILDITHFSTAAPVLNSGYVFFPYREYKQFRGEINLNLEDVNNKLDKLLLQQRSFRRPESSSPSPYARSTLCFYHECFGHINVCSRALCIIIQGHQVC